MAKVALAPVGVQQLMSVDHVTVSQKMTFIKETYVVESPGFGIMFTIKSDWSDYIVKDKQKQTIGNIKHRGGWVEWMKFEVRTVNWPPILIRPKGGLSRSLLLTDETGLSILKLKPAGVFDTSYHILAKDDVTIGELKPSTFGFQYTVTFPRDLDVRYKMAIVAAVLYLVTASRNEQKLKNELSK